MIYQVVHTGLAAPKGGQGAGCAGLEAGVDYGVARRGAQPHTWIIVALVREEARVGGH